MLTERLKKWAAVLWGDEAPDSQVQQSQARLAEIVESSDDAILSKDLGGIVQSWNGGAHRLFGYSAEEIIGRPIATLVPPERSAEEEQIFQRLRRGERVDHLETVRRTKDGRTIDVSVTISPIRDPAGRIVGASTIARDITERKRAEEELRAARDAAEWAKAEAEEANRVKDRFLAVLSHELRTPLTPVTMAVSMLQDRPDLNFDMRDKLELIRRNVEMEARLIDDLLDVTRIARGTIELNRTPVELSTIIRRSIEVCRPDIEAQGLHFRADLDSAESYWVEVDIPRLQQVFWKLLENAIKFTPRGGCVGIRCRLEKTEGEMGGGGERATGASPSPSSLPPLAPSPPRPLNSSRPRMVLIEVTDSGVGIEPEAMPRIFRAFEQGERAVTRKFGGLGLGLAISKALVEMHGGTISVFSEGRGRGASFQVRLPLTAAPEPSESPAPAKSPHRAPRHLRILLVEDHGVTAQMMRLVLAAEGHSVEMAGNVATAMKLANEHPFDLLVSDLGLPDGTGHDLMRQLRSRGRALPGIAISGYGQDEDIQRSHEAGFSTHLTKPASRQRLVEAIESVATG